MAWQALNFTAPALTALEIRAKEYWVKDSGGKLSVDGLVLRIYPSGTKKYYLLRRINKRTIKLPLGTFGHITHVQAREKARLELAQIVVTGIDPIQAKKARREKSITLDDAYAGFLNGRGIRNSTKAKYDTSMRLYFSHWRKRPLVQITRDDILHEYATAKKRSETGANSAMRLLRAIFNHADAEYEDVHGARILIDNPVNQLSKNKAWAKEKSRTRRIRKGQFTAWFDAVAQVEQVQGDYLTLLLFTGLRRREATSLRWSDIDLKDASLSVPVTKSGEPLTIPLSSPVIELLKRRYNTRTSSEWVFPSTSRSGHIEEPKKAVAKIADICGVTASPHDLRRTFVSVAESAELSPYVIKRLINHAATDVTEVHYIDIEFERLRVSSQRVAALIQGYTSNTKFSTVLPFKQPADIDS